MSAVATPDMPEGLPPLPEPEEGLLAKLRHANDVLLGEEKDVEAAAQAAYRKVTAERQVVLSRFRAVVYAILADCYAAGFTTADINRELSKEA